MQFIDRGRANKLPLESRLLCKMPQMYQRLCNDASADSLDVSIAIDVSCLQPEAPQIFGCAETTLGGSRAHQRIVRGGVFRAASHEALKSVHIEAPELSRITPYGRDRVREMRTRVRNAVAGVAGKLVPAGVLTEPGDEGQDRQVAGADSAAREPEAAALEPVQSAPVEAQPPSISGGLPEPCVK